MDRNIIGWFDGEEEAQAAAQSGPRSPCPPPSNPQPRPSAWRETICSALILGAALDPEPAGQQDPDYMLLQRGISRGDHVRSFQKAATEAGKMPLLEQGSDVSLLPQPEGTPICGDKLAAEFTSRSTRAGRGIVLSGPVETARHQGEQR